MSTIYNEIQTRHGKRKQIEREVSKLRPPSIHSKASRSDFNKIIGNKTEEFNEECLLVTHDFQVLQVALANIESDCPGVDVGKYITEAWNQTPMDEEKQKALDLRDYEEAEARAKQSRSDKKQGEIDGQLNLFDDGSEAEAATDCVTVNDITPESHRLPDYGNLADTLPGREISDEEVDSLEGPNITDEQLAADIEKAQAELDASPSKVEPAEAPVNELAAKAAAKKGRPKKK